MHAAKAVHVVLQRWEDLGRFPPLPKLIRVKGFFLNPNLSYLLLPYFVVFFTITPTYRDDPPAKGGVEMDLYICKCWLLEGEDVG